MIMVVSVRLLMACFAFLPITTSFSTAATTRNNAANPISMLHLHLQDPSEECYLESSSILGGTGTSRRVWLASGVAMTATLPILPAQAVVAPSAPKKKCTDIETCREIGEQKVALDLQENPVTTLPSGTRYKVLQPGVGSEVVQEGSSIDLIYTLSRAGGQYMYSQGFGYEQVEMGNGNKVKDISGLDSLRVKVGSHQQVPVGIEQSLLGMRKGERRRVELTPNVGLATSNWEPTPKTAAGKQSVKAYQRVLEGFGSQPPFPAPTIWDVEVLRIRN